MHIITNKITKSGEIASVLACGHFQGGKTKLILTQEGFTSHDLCERILEGCSEALAKEGRGCIPEEV